MAILWILSSTFLVSIISLIGVLTISMNEKLLETFLFGMIGFSAGALIGTTFLHILPEALEQSPSIFVFSCLICGLVMFFMLERYLHWRHCHQERCDIHAFTYLNLVGDGFHNFIDGMVITASYLISVKLGVVTTLAIILHEIPQELGDFGVLIYGGMSKKKALGYNFISALMAVVGALFGYFISDFAAGFSAVILPLVAGGFIYIAASDLIPEIHKERDMKRSTYAFIFFLFGIAAMILAKILLPK